LRIANAHLDTRLNSEERLDQLEPVIRECEEFRGPQIVGGDFNSNDFYWLGRVLPLPRPQSQSRAVHNLMTKRGFRTPVPVEQPTFDYLGMKLDWIYAAGLESRDAEIYPLQFSDHHAVWARFSFGSDPGHHSPQLP
jgi:endonuclease/exonuclease/phosphatase (EEP) superfamily protein YafD